MSSWFTNLANSLGVDNNEQENDEEETNTQKDPSSNPQNKKDDDIETSSSTDDLNRGVKEDLSELTKTLTRQLWGVASFLAPPPPSQPPPPVSDWNKWESDKSVSADISESETARITGIRNDFAEIGGRFKNEISKLSSHKAVSEFSKIASTFLPFGKEEEDDDDEDREEEEEDLVVGDAVGVTKEVLTFARNIAMHPETWLDFPLADDEDSDDFDLSDAQQEHALAVERFAPRLAALRIEICPGYMSEGCFWKIYFVLLHSRLNKHDAELLSTPQIVEARAMLTQDLQNRTRSHELSGRGTSFSKGSTNSPQEEHYSSLSDVPSENVSLKTFACEPSHFLATTNVETEKHPVVSTEMQIVDKSVVEEEPIVHKNKDIPVNSSSKFLDPNYEEDGDEWLEDESSEVMGSFNQNSIPLGNEEDVSFSDLEDDDDGKSTPTSSKAVTVDSSKKESRDWVQLEKSSSNSRRDLSVGTGSIGSEQAHVIDRDGKDHDNKDCSEWLSVDDIDVI